MGVRYRIREASEADLPAIVAIERASFGDPWPREAFAELLGPGALVATVDALVVAFLFARTVADESDILDLAVSPDFRRSGAAVTLVTYLFRELIDKGVASVFLEVRASNAPALGLYRRLGFESIGVRSGYYTNPREDALVLRRVLEPNSPLA